MSWSCPVWSCNWYHKVMIKQSLFLPRDYQAARDLFVVLADMVGGGGALCPIPCPSGSRFVFQALRVHTVPCFILSLVLFPEAQAFLCPCCPSGISCALKLRHMSCPGMWARGKRKGRWIRSLLQRLFAFPLHSLRKELGAHGVGTGALEGRWNSHWWSSLSSHITHHCFP